MRRFVSRGERDTFEYGKMLADTVKSGDVVALSGGMGAGKTAFVKGLCKGLGYDGEVTSPTFALVHEYEGKYRICHFDMFRIADESMLEGIGFDDYLDGGNILAIEWSENIAGALPEDCIRVRMSYGNTPEERIIEIEGGASHADSCD